MLITVNKIASVTKNIPLKKKVHISDNIIAKEGYLLVVEVLENKRIYNQLELTSGRLSTLRMKDILVVALGQRRALKGFVGEIPAKVIKGDTIHILNLGGVAGICTSENLTEVGHALKVKVLGAVVDEKGKHIHMKKFKLFKNAKKIESDVPLIVVSGTCMNVGKTLAACKIIKSIADHNYKIYSAKLAGIAALRDIKNMHDYGAQKTVSIIDAGYTSTILNKKESLEITKGAINYLSLSHPDYILIELGDGILGEYGVLDILKDKEFQKNIKAHVGCAYDLAGASKLAEICKAIGVPLNLISGPVTDNSVGITFINKNLGLAAINSLNNGEKIFPYLVEKIL